MPFGRGLTAQCAIPPVDRAWIQGAHAEVVGRMQAGSPIGSYKRMADIEITQAEADTLIAMEKRFLNSEDWTFPMAGERMALELASVDRRENFMLDITRAQIKLTKATYQNRARQSIILMRLDLDGPPHRNPDGAEIPCPHLHTYREGFGDKWANAVPADRYPDTEDLFATCEAFMQHCNISGPARMQRGLFS